jgi:hypothetical protein
MYRSLIFESFQKFQNFKKIQKNLKLSSVCLRHFFRQEKQRAFRTVTQEKRVGHQRMRELTAGEECQQAARTCSAFVGQGGQGTVPALLVRECMGLAILKGSAGVAVIRLPSGGNFVRTDESSVVSLGRETTEWSAPCAIALESSQTPLQETQETVLLFMTEQTVFSLVTRARLALNETHRWVECLGLKSAKAYFLIIRINPDLHLGL